MDSTTSNFGKTWITPDRLLLGGVLLAALIVRGGALWALRGNLDGDPDAYRQIAENLLRHGVFAMGDSDDPPPPTAFRPPLYPIVLSNLPDASGHNVSLGKVAVLHVLLGVATVWLTWLVARRVGSARASSAGPPLAGQASDGGPAAADHRSAAVPALSHPTIAALLVACDPILLNQQSLVMTETLATFLAVLALWCLARFSERPSWFWAGLSGGAIGLAALCRPTFLPWLGLVGIAMVVIQNSDFRIQKCSAQARSWWAGLGVRLARALALVAVAATVMSPWVIRNYRLFGEPIATTTHGGYTLMLANNDSFYRWLREDQTGLPWKSTPFDYRWEMETTVHEWLMTPESPMHRERRMDQLAYERAHTTIGQQPRMFALACLYRVGQLWSPLPHRLTAEESMGRRLLRYATCVWYCGVYALAAVGLWRLRGKLLEPPWIYGLLLCLAFTAVHTFYWTNLRMRAPLMPFVALVAAVVFAPSGVHGLRTRERP